MKPTLELQYAIDIVQRIHDEANAAHPMPKEFDWKERGPVEAHYKAGREAVERLASEHGAIFRYQAGSTYTLRFAGVASSCTGGEWGLMTNWLAAARRKLAQSQSL